MKPAMKNVLVIPGKEKLAEGPGSGWVEQLEANLNLVLKRYTAEQLTILTPGVKISKELFAGPVNIILLMHRSFGESEEYIRFLTGISSQDLGSIRNFIRIDTSLRDSEKLPEAINFAVTIKLTDPDAGENEWLEEDSPVYW